MLDGEVGPVAISNDERTLAIVAHIVGAFISFWGPIIVLLASKNSTIFVKDQAKEALNFHLTIMFVELSIAFVVFLMLLTLPLVFGFIALLSLAVFPTLGFFCGLIGAITVSHGQPYHYFFSIRWIK